jgi:chaperonin GroEL
VAVSKARGGAQQLSFAPDNQRQLQDGIAVLERTLGPTLGPGGRPVAIERIGRPHLPPELLDDGSTIARRITGIPDHFANMGLMLARHAAWKMRTEVHDGAATAVVILAAAHRDLQKQIAAGANRVELRCQVESAIARATALIAESATPLAPSDYEAFAATVSGSADVARIVAEAYDLLGPDATVVTRASRGRKIELECIEGALWESTSVIAPLAGPDSRQQLNRPRVLLWDGPLDDVRSLATALGHLRADGARAVLIVAQSFTPDVLGLITVNTSTGFAIVPVTAPHEGQQQDWAYDDLAALTGSKRLSDAAGEALARFDPSTAGTVARATIGPRFLNILTSDEQPAAVERNIATVRHLMSITEDEKEWQRLHLRLGRLQQGMGVIWVGAATETERDHLLLSVERTLSALRSAATSGVVPGAGATLLTVSRCLTASSDNLGVQVAAKALAAPARWIADNVGGNTEARQVVDPASTVIEAVRIGLSTALLAADCGVLIRRPIALHQAEIRP